MRRRPVRVEQPPATLPPITVSDPRHDFPKVERLLRYGQPIEITKRNRVIAKLIPIAPAAKPEWPDFLGRLKQIYGGKKLKVTAAQRIAEERDRY